MQSIGLLECESSAFAAKVLTFRIFFERAIAMIRSLWLFRVDQGQTVNLEPSFEILRRPGGRPQGNTSAGSERCPLVPFLNLAVRNYNLPIMVPIDRRIHMADEP